MSVHISSMGKLSDGREARRFTLRNQENTEASFTDLGAIWLTMLVKDRQGGFRDVVLGCEDPERLLENPGHMGETVGRNANRIGGGHFTLGGKEYSLSVNDNGKNNLHSGPDYWRLRLWEAECGESDQGSYVRFSLLSPDMDQGFPGELRLSVSYTLTEENELQIRYEGVSDQDTLFNMTNHAYFNLNGHASGSAEEQIIWINADRFTPATEFSVPTGELRPVEGTPMDFRKPKKISRDIEADFDQLRFATGYDHNWCLNDFRSGELRLAASAFSEESGIRMEMRTDLEGLQFYTANYLNAPGAGKGGVSYGRRYGYCFETQHYPDCINKENFPSPLLRAGERGHSMTAYRFSVES